ncbi:hypothetical protein H6G33_10725 [Calothrix sp. FACHB-1219]|uniref:hypothetical protein n=1 Tax=unclassified Calothrix TaxID=2619626 RepID=UPI0016844A57|nr:MULTISPECIES: hypothetical protein [unclassified Calothrix]MBD2201822.1 hypothetical protein [Calothrix sp. FACHB-168]MBD2217508.1 hypothetical protein [Calothrix sp. FACHB-1219]
MAQSNGVFNCVSKTIDGEHHIAFCLMTIKPAVDCIISSSDTYEKYVEVYNSLMIPFIKRKLEVIKKITDIATQEELELVGIDTNKWELSLKEYVVE